MAAVMERLQSQRPSRVAAAQNLSEQNGTHRDEALSEEEEGKQERQFQGPEITFNHLWFLDATASKVALSDPVSKHPNIRLRPKRNLQAYCRIAMQSVSYEKPSSKRDLGLGAELIAKRAAFALDADIPFQVLDHSFCPDCL